MSLAKRSAPCLERRASCGRRRCWWLLLVRLLRRIVSRLPDTSALGHDCEASHLHSQILGTPSSGSLGVHNASSITVWVFLNTLSAHLPRVRPGLCPSYSRRGALVNFYPSRTRPTFLSPAPFPSRHPFILGDYPLINSLSAHLCLRDYNVLLAIIPKSRIINNIPFNTSSRRRSNPSLNPPLPSSNSLGRCCLSKIP